jgi:hypothetical protein
VVLCSFSAAPKINAVFLSAKKWNEELLKDFSLIVPRNFQFPECGDDRVLGFYAQSVDC